ncbi:MULTISPECIES: DUF1963 domain-containing protein [Kitasatospora]|uniref:DUF1963 domain-containing protein n=1 Tax=Kitasatospora cathayae TaxID=3004092 RepID=A0ABY7QDI8_9ACTN|nr:DUF1963 domain-containing protein [Kitasatospora sp. HUAS 3-15]WBP90825.1 DUF1963 domain-containing protein [Kitasatospora sp. HUAS 3-15]
MDARMPNDPAWTPNDPASPVDDRLPGLPMPYRLHTALVGRVGTEGAARVGGLLRASLELSPDVAEDAVGWTPVGRTGGSAALPEGIDWPQGDGHPMELLAQLDCAGMAEAFRAGNGGRWPLPADGLLLFFHDPMPADLDGESCRVLHVPAGAPERPAPPDPDGVEPLAGRTVRARWALSAPSYLDDELVELCPGDFLTAMGVSDEFGEQLGTPGIRVLGWCDSHNTTRPAGHRPLLQVEGSAAGASWGELVNVSVWITDQDLAAGRFDRVRHGMEVA